MADRTPLQRKLIRWFLHPPQTVGAFLLYGLLRIMPVDAASAFGGWLLRTVGPLTRSDAIARRNLERAFPDKDRGEIDRIVRGVWDNFGRVIGEWPHLNRLYRSGFGGRVEILGREHLECARDAGGPVIVVTGHHGNWELTGAVCAAHGLPLTVIYRPTQNALVNYLVLWARRHFTGGLLPKGKEAAVGALALLREGGKLGVLIDQKLNEGVPVPFFGRDAMTSPVAARLAVGFRCPVLPVRAERTAGARYRVTIYPPMAIPDSGDRKRDQETVLLDMNHMLEGWVRECPEQWFWVHRRWPD
ncbi:MAG: lauroyl acyltransferase [Alphaproteobacteria bacterium]|nr:lauroyl acyltransferase [Alphaproteobacteria bacterium]